MLTSRPSLSGRSLSAEEEIDLAHRMRAAESVARELVEGISVADEKLSRRRKRSYKTRAVKVEHLIAAVEACEAVLHTLSSEEATRVRAARVHLCKAESLRWELAMSAAHLPRIEASRLANPLMGREDLAQYGFMGLLDAAIRFDPERGIRFGSYARWWVRAQMTRAIEHGGRSVRLPGGAVEQLRRLRGIAAELESVGEEATDELLAEESGLSVRRVRFLLSRGDAVSLDNGGDEEGLSLRERIADEQPRGEADDQLATAELLERLSGIFDDVLDEREKYIIRHHFGLDELEPRSMTAIGKTLNLSRERIRQLEVRAFQHLREAL